MPLTAAQRRMLLMTLLSIALVALDGVAKSLADGTVTLPPAWAWVTSVIVAGIGALRLVVLDEINDQSGEDD